MVAVLDSFMKDRYMISEQRLDHCRKCEHFEERTSRCDKCGCFMNYKTLMKSASCPIGKWNKWEEKVPEQKEEK